MTDLYRKGYGSGCMIYLRLMIQDIPSLCSAKTVVMTSSVLVPALPLALVFALPMGPGPQQGT